MKPIRLDIRRWRAPLGTSASRLTMPSRLPKKSTSDVRGQSGSALCPTADGQRVPLTALSNCSKPHTLRVHREFSLPNLGDSPDNA
jgi:hypothetical protein